MTTALQTQTRDPRSFVDPSVWDRQITLLVRDHPFDRVMAERLFGCPHDDSSRPSGS
jgi:hypothetical protein